MPRIPRLLWLLLLASEALLCGCASHGEARTDYKRAPPAETRKALLDLRDEASRHPDDISLQQRYYTQRDQAEATWLLQAKEALSHGQLDKGQEALLAILEVDPRQPMALALQSQLTKEQVRQAELSKAKEALANGQPVAAESILKKQLAQNASDSQARALLGQAHDAQRKQELAQALDPKFAQEKVSLEFQNASLNSVFYALSQQSGLNFSFEPSVQLNASTTLYAKDTPVLNVLDMLISSHHLRQHVLNGNTMGIGSEPAAQQSVMSHSPDAKAFYLTNTHPKEVRDLLQSMTSLHSIYIDDALNLVVVKGTPQELQAAQDLIAMIDRAPPEVMLDVEVLEVKRDLLRNLGMEYPNQFSLLNVTPSATSVTTTTGTTVTTPSATPLTLQSLRSIHASQITINQLMLNLKDDSGDVKLLANPRIRVKNQVQAQIKIGERVPVFNSNTTSTGVISSSVSYLDVGLDLKVKPTVMLDSDVQIEVALEVSNILNQVSGGNGAVGYQIGTRDANTTLRLADGQTQILAGLISDQQQKTFSGIPGLGRIPVIGRLFSNHQDSNSKTEIVLLITPHIVRNLDVAQSDTNTSSAVSLATGEVTNTQAPAFTQPTLVGSTATDTPTSSLPKNLPPGFVPPGTRLPPGFLSNTETQ